jgi:Asp-tRNA(Asn)/Glu-tRNA(Gln) amidotransferase A subunit family amidase
VAEDLLLDQCDSAARDLGARRLHAGGLPVGIQIVGRHREDRSVLELARAFEQATKFGERRPPI